MWKTLIVDEDAWTPVANLCPTSDGILACVEHAAGDSFLALTTICPRGRHGKQSSESNFCIVGKRFEVGVCGLPDSLSQSLVIGTRPAKRARYDCDRDRRCCCDTPSLPFSMLVLRCVIVSARLSRLDICDGLNVFQSRRDQVIIDIRSSA